MRKTPHVFGIGMLILGKSKAFVRDTGRKDKRWNDEIAGRGRGERKRGFSAKTQGGGDHSDHEGRSWGGYFEFREKGGEVRPRILKSHREGRQVKLQMARDRREKLNFCTQAPLKRAGRQVGMDAAGTEEIKYYPVL